MESKIELFDSSFIEQKTFSNERILFSKPECEETHVSGLSQRIKPGGDFKDRRRLNTKLLENLFCDGYFNLITLLFNINCLQFEPWITT